MNTVILTGRLTRDVELSNSQGGTGYLRNCLAVKSEFKNKDGEYSTHFFNFSAFGKTAEIIANYCSKGSLILIKGHLSNGSITTDKGINLTTNELIVDNVDLIESKKKEENVDYNNNNSLNNVYYNNNNVQNNNNSPFDNVKSQFDIDSSDLPF
jgi:single-strand DNA-binding protein